MSKAVVGWSVLAIVVLAGAGWVATRAPGAAPGAGPLLAGPAPEGNGRAVSVTTVRARERDVDVTVEATGTVTAINSVDVRPQVASVITRVAIREGQFVKAGQLLFTLDARSDEVNLAKARAQLARDQASLADAQRQFDRSRDLLAQNFISQGAVDTARTLVETQQSVVAADRAAIDAAQVGLSYSRIHAPLSGRAGAIGVHPGTTVQPGAAALVTITQLDPIAVAFSLPQRNLNDALQTLRSGAGDVLAILPEGRGQRSGKLKFVDSAVDANSGTVRMKAHFANPDEALWPGAFVTVRLALRTLKHAIVVPQAAVIPGPAGSVVYVVDDRNTVSLRPIEIAHALGTEAVVKGVAAGERVVVDGRQNLRPGVTVVERADPQAAGTHDPGVASKATARESATGAPVRP